MNISGNTKILGLLGNPVRHTLSPIIHNTLCECLGLDMCYLPFEVEKDAIGHAIKGAYALGITGLNATVPFKEAVIPELVAIDSAADAIGAVNTLVRVDGGFKGYNTDMEGLRQAVLSEGVSLKGRDVIVLGAGGASRAVCYMCELEGAKRIFLLNRTLSKAMIIADIINTHFGSDRVIPMELSGYSKLLEHMDGKCIVFQASSVGLHPHEKEALITDPGFYDHVEIGFDLIYNPAKTRFMELVGEHGGRAFNGLKMLLYQGIIAFSYWSGVELDKLMEYEDVIYEKLYKAIYKKDNIVLIGFMGAGKTTIGKRLSKKLGYAFVDTDEYIETREGMKISEIFEKKGEAYFRNLETEVLKELMENASKTVFSTGGGLPLREENARLLRLLGDTVYLRATADQIFKRVGKSTNRPLLKCEDPRGRIESLLRERSDKYESCGMRVIDTGALKPDEIVNLIIEKEI